MRLLSLFTIFLSLFALVPVHADEVKGPDGKVYEKILVPLAGVADGAHGTRWVAQVSAFNGGSEVVRVTGAPEVLDYEYDPSIPSCGVIGSAPECLGLFPPGGAGRVRNVDWREGVWPGFIYVETHGAKVIFLNGEAGISHQFPDTGLGVSLPLVQEEETSSRAAVVRVPLLPDHRYMVRVYGYDSIEWPVAVTVRDGRGIQSVRQVTLQALPIPYPGAFPDPSYAQLRLQDLIPAADELPRDPVTFEFEAPPGAKIWAMVSATDNATQDFAVYSSEVAVPCEPAP